MKNIHNYVLNKYLHPQSIINMAKTKIYIPISPTQILGYYLFNSTFYMYESFFLDLSRYKRLRKNTQLKYTTIVKKYIRYINCSNYYICDLYVLLQLYYKHFTYDDINILIRFISIDSWDTKSLKVLINKDAISNVRIFTTICRCNILENSLINPNDNTVYITQYSSRIFVSHVLPLIHDNNVKKMVIQKLILRSDIYESQVLAGKLLNYKNFLNEYCNAYERFGTLKTKWGKFTINIDSYSDDLLKPRKKFDFSTLDRNNHVDGAISTKPRKKHPILSIMKEIEKNYVNFMKKKY